jgi:hypothetical protein
MIARLVTDDSGIVCAGDKVRYEVEVIKRVIGGTEEQARGSTLTGVKITAQASAPAVLAIKSRNTITTSPSGVPPGSATFEFRAAQDGYSNVQFQASIPKEYLDEEDLKQLSAEELRKMLTKSIRTLDLRVIQCPFEVFWREHILTGTGPSEMEMSAVAKVELRAVDGDPRYLRGEGLQHIAIRVSDPACGYKIVLGSRYMEILGERTTDGNYIISHKTGKDKLNYTVSCPGGSASFGGDEGFPVPTPARLKPIEMGAGGGNFSDTLSMPFYESSVRVYVRPRKPQ